MEAGKSTGEKGKPPNRIRANLTHILSSQGPPPSPPCITGQPSTGPSRGRERAARSNLKRNGKGEKRRGREEEKKKNEEEDVVGGGGSWTWRGSKFSRAAAKSKKKKKSGFWWRCSWCDPSSSSNAEGKGEEAISLGEGIKSFQRERERAELIPMRSGIDWSDTRRQRFIGIRRFLASIWGKKKSFFSFP